MPTETLIAQDHRAGTRSASIDRSIARRQSVNTLVRFSETDAGRCKVEDFIAAEFRKHFDASVTEFMPTLAALYGESGEMKAAVGYRSAAACDLFLEIYTGNPIEEVLHRQAGIRVPRREIVEVGGLACRGGRAAMEMIKALAPVLIESGFSWVVFTGADTVRNVFQRLDLRTVALCIANKSLLGERWQEWGSYYDHNPVVMAGRIAEGVDARRALA